jgi:cysteine synthase A
MILENILNTIGCTPVVKLNKLVSGDAAQVLMKIEFFNPGSSVKDRIAYSMIEEAERSGRLKKGMTILEPTSGNTGIGLALVAAVKGYPIIFTMPASMSEERKSVLAYLGARLVLTPGEEGMVGAVMKAQSMLEEGDYFMPQQFENQANPEIHRKATAREIIHDLGDLPLDFLVVGVGTGGTITGVGEVLKEKYPDLKVVAVEPASSAVLSNENPGPHKIQGIGPGFIPDILNLEVIDEVIKVESEDAIQTARKLCRKEGIFAGISSGANVWASLQVAEKAGRGNTVLTFLPDTGERYISTELFSDIRKMIQRNGD